MMERFGQKIMTKTIIGLLRKTPTLTGSRFLRIDYEPEFPESWNAGCGDWTTTEKPTHWIDYSKMGISPYFWHFYNSELGLPANSPEVWPPDYD